MMPADAGKEFPMQAHALGSTVLRASLPGSSAEVELHVPLAWPTSAGAAISVEALVSTQDHVDLSPVMSALTAQPSGRDLKQLLAAVKASVKAHAAEEVASNNAS